MFHFNSTIPGTCIQQQSLHETKPFFVGDRHPEEHLLFPVLRFRLVFFASLLQLANGDPFPKDSSGASGLWASTWEFRDQHLGCLLPHHLTTTDPTTTDLEYRPSPLPVIAGVNLFDIAGQRHYILRRNHPLARIRDRTAGASLVWCERRRPNPNSGAANVKSILSTSPQSICISTSFRTRLCLQGLVCFHGLGGCCVCFALYRIPTAIHRLFRLISPPHCDRACFNRPPFDCAASLRVCCQQNDLVVRTGRANPALCAIWHSIFPPTNVLCSLLPLATGLSCSRPAPKVARCNNRNCMQPGEYVV